MAFTLSGHGALRCGSDRVKLTDLIDLEAQQVLDEGVDSTRLRDRDRAIYLAQSAEVKSEPRRVLAAWLDALRARGGGSSVGATVATGQRLVGYGLAVAGLMTGAGTAAALLYYDGREPVNVGTFLLVVVFGQLALLAGGAAVALFGRWLAPQPFATDLHRALGWLAERLEPAVTRANTSLPADFGRRLQVARGRLRTRSGLYAPVERWVFIELTQVFGIAFNIGVLAVCLRLIFFSDLAFGWSTTGDALDASTVYSVVRGLAIPWAGWLPDAVPTRELVAASRFSRLQGGFPSGATEMVVGQWWQFLVAAVVTYGLVPRVVLWLTARALKRSALARIPVDTPDVQLILHRLTAPRIETRAQDAPPPSAVVPAGQTAPLARPLPAAEIAAERSCLLIRWRQVPAGRSAVERTIRTTFGLRVDGAVDAGGVDLAADSASQRAAADATGPVVVLAEAWEAPDKGVRRFLTGLRASVGRTRPIFVALVGEGDDAMLAPPEPSDVAVWKDRLTLLEDPYLGVQPVDQSEDQTGHPPGDAAGESQ